MHITLYINIVLKYLNNYHECELPAYLDMDISLRNDNLLYAFWKYIVLNDNTVLIELISSI